MTENTEIRDNLIINMPIRIMRLIEDICQDLVERTPVEDRRPLEGNDIVMDSIIHGFAHLLSEKELGDKNGRCQALEDLLTGAKHNYVSE